ncbi:MarR family winged helix-turn-helix transcriptional regulator [Sulfitobacter sp. G21635-S1]|uniref:MarR family winged helix-turn-helix transcriptional regulator n=1 Tax=Sulfitobacter sp. G21635-S1 TaxID=3014043 RepID=UPI0022B03BF8|nr:MarR family winged helix-turn-helix transcriptional regulator [Sulfitobacter sp. G21635-S1]MCZ4256977.1 MarR family winged helix-turn-helix transcriptional regulator [Sulfitobacter sp. G21635-S1]
MSEFEQTTPYLKSLPTRLLSLAGTRGSGLSRSALAKHCATQFDFAVMATLVGEGAISQAELCRRTGLDRKDIATVVTDLEKRGDVERSTDLGDARRKIVDITSQGASRFAELKTVMAESQAVATAMLSADEKQALIAILNKMLASR